jgi:hypothetical protein
MKDLEATEENGYDSPIGDSTTGNTFTMRTDFDEILPEISGRESLSSSDSMDNSVTRTFAGEEVGQVWGRKSSSNSDSGDNTVTRTLFSDEGVEQSSITSSQYIDSDLSPYERQSLSGLLVAAQPSRSISEASHGQLVNVASIPQLPTRLESNRRPSLQLQSTIQLLQQQLANGQQRLQLQLQRQMMDQHGCTPANLSIQHKFVPLSQHQTRPQQQSQQQQLMTSLDRSVPTALLEHPLLPQDQQISQPTPRGSSVPGSFTTAHLSIQQNFLPLSQHQTRPQQQSQQQQLMTSLDRSVPTALLEHPLLPQDQQISQPTPRGSSVPGSFTTASWSPSPEQSLLPLPKKKSRKKNRGTRIKTANELSARELTFPLKLHRILADPSFQVCIGWLPHGKSWRILNQKMFVDMLMLNQNLYFKHASYESFMRQVNGESVGHGVSIPFLHFLLVSHKNIGCPFLGWGFKRARKSRLNDSLIPLYTLTNKVLFVLTQFLATSRPGIQLVFPRSKSDYQHC